MAAIMTEMVIKYFSARMLATLDLNQLFQCLFERFGECQITFVPMSPKDRARASAQIDGIEAVNERFWILHRAGHDLIRQTDVEETIVRIGQK
jgi:hypothetical protein